MPKCKQCGKNVSALSGDLLGTTCKECEAKLAAAQLVIACPKCGATNPKKSFFGGAKSAAKVALYIGIFCAFCAFGAFQSRDSSGLFYNSILAVIFVLAGIAALQAKQYECTQCKTKFNPTVSK
jgi:DNA-directed RNA polymerase subunit RPC12/RpoP